MRGLQRHNLSQCLRFLLILICDIRLLLQLCPPRLISFLNKQASFPGFIYDVKSWTRLTLGRLCIRFSGCNVQIASNDCESMFLSRSYTGENVGEGEAPMRFFTSLRVFFHVGACTRFFNVMCNQTKLH